MHVEMKLNIFASLITRAESLKRHLIIQWRWYQLLLHALLGGTLIHKLNSWIEICWKNILKCDILDSIEKATRSILRYDIKISNEIYFSNIWLNHLNDSKKYSSIKIYSYIKSCSILKGNKITKILLFWQLPSILTFCIIMSYINIETFIPL